MGLLSAGHGGRQRGCYFTMVWASVVASSADWPFCGAETPPTHAEGWMQLFLGIMLGELGPASCLSLAFICFMANYGDSAGSHLEFHTGAFEKCWRVAKHSGIHL